jgi:dipeptidyl aminopeptidase/acylaminoacyl peptidase
MLTPNKGSDATRRASNSGQIGVAGAFEWPSILPEGKHAIVTDRLHAYLLTLATGESRQLVSAAGRQARYLQPGYIIYTETGEKLRAVAFDLATQEITGQPFPVLDNVFRAPGAGAVYFDVSRTGTLLYVVGGFQRSLVLADSEGTLESITDDKRGFRFPRFSPDGNRVLVAIDPRPTNLWIYDIARGIGERLTSDGHQVAPLWHSGSNGIVFNQNRTIRGMDPDRPDRIERIFPANGRLSTGFFPSSSTSDGRVIVGTRRITATQTDIHVLTTGDSPQLTAWLQTDSAEQLAHIRPDGNWISYASDDTGRTEVYVQTFPEPGTRTRVTSGGGTDPTWSRDGKKLFYRQGDKIMVVEIATEPTVAISEPTLFVRTELDTTQIRNWDVGPEDRVVLIESDPTTTREFQVVLNWSRAVQDMEK